MGMKPCSNPPWFSPQVKVEVLWQRSVRKADTAAVSLQVCQAATFLSSEAQGFGLLRCVFITTLNFVLSEVLSFGWTVNASEQGKFVTCS